MQNRAIVSLRQAQLVDTARAFTARLGRTLLALCLSLGACQSAADTPNPPVLESATPADVRVANLDWLTGTWRGPVGEGQIEEQWSATTPGSIAALVRIFDASGTNMLELVSISDEPAGLTLRIQQWSAQFEPRSPTPQTMRLAASSAVGPHSIRFEASSEGSLQQLEYISSDPESLVVRVTTSNGNQFDLPLRRIAHPASNGTGD